MQLWHVIVVIVVIALAIDFYNRFELITSGECPECETTEHLSAMIRCTKCGRLL